MPRVSSYFSISAPLFFSQAASCLVSATLNNNNNQHKKKRRKKKKKKEKEKKILLFTSRLHVHLPQPSVLYSLRSRGPGSAWVGAARGRWAGGSAGGARTLGFICISHCGVRWWPPGRARLPLGPSLLCVRSSRSGRAINKPRRPVATLSTQRQRLVAAWCGYPGPGPGWRGRAASSPELKV